MQAVPMEALTQALSKSANVFTQCTVSFAMTSLSLIIRKSLQLDFLAIV